MPDNFDNFEDSILGDHSRNAYCFPIIQVKDFIFGAHHSRLLELIVAFILRLIDLVNVSRKIISSKWCESRFEILPRFEMKREPPYKAKQYSSRLTWLWLIVACIGCKYFAASRFGCVEILQTGTPESDFDIIDASISNEIVSRAIPDILVITRLASAGADFVDRLASAEAGFASKLLLKNSMRALAKEANESMRALTMDTKESMRALAVQAETPMQELAMEMHKSMRALAMKVQESMRALTIETAKSMRALTIEADKPMRALASQIKSVVQQERMRATLASSTESFSNRDFQIAVFLRQKYTAFREGEWSTAAWCARRREHVAQRSRSDGEICPGVSIPNTKIVFASSHDLLMRASASNAMTCAETRGLLEAAIPSANCTHRSHAPIATGASVPSEKLIVACVSNIPTNFWTLPSERDQSSSFPSMAAYYCVDPRTQVPEGEMPQLIVTLMTPNEGAFGVTRSQLIVAFGINVSPVPGCPLDFEVPWLNQKRATLLREGEYNDNGQEVQEDVAAMSQDNCFINSRLIVPKEESQKPNRKPPDKYTVLTPIAFASEGGKLACTAVVIAAGRSKHDGAIWLGRWRACTYSKEADMPSTSASARDRLTSSLVRGTAIATSIAAGMAVVTTSVAADLSADSAAVAASTAAVALAGALAKAAKLSLEFVAASIAAAAFVAASIAAAAFVAASTAAGARSATGIAAVLSQTVLRDSINCRRSMRGCSGILIAFCGSNSHSSPRGSIRGALGNSNQAAAAKMIAVVVATLQWLDDSQEFLQVSFPRECENTLYSQNFIWNFWNQTNSNLKSAFLADRFSNSTLRNSFIIQINSDSNK